MTVSGGMSDALFDTLPDPNEGPPGVDYRARYGQTETLGERLAQAYPGRAIGAHQDLAVSTTPVRLAAVSGALTVRCQVQGAPVRYRLDGGAPTSTAGFRADVGAWVTLTGWPDITAAQFVAETSTAATIAAQAYA
jgi:hypothetical protein